MSDATNAVFLSYASQDAEAARRICDALRSGGVEVWFDQSELVGGDSWDTKIRKQIKECALFVPVISAATQARTEGYFRLEWRLADQRTHLMAKGRAFLLPVVIDDTTDADAAVPDSFTEVQWTRLPGGETTPAFCERVRKLLRGDEATAGAALRRDGSAASGHQAPRAASRRDRGRRWWALAAAGVAAAAVLVLLLREARREPLPATRLPVAVAPLTEAQKYLAQAQQAYEGGDEINRDNLFLAEELVQRALALDPAEPAAWEFAAWLSYIMVWHSIDESSPRRDKMLQQANRAVALAPDSVAARLMLATARLGTAQSVRAAMSETSQLEEIERELTALAAREPANWKIQRALGTTYRFMNQTDDAIRCLQRAVELSGEHPMASADLVNVLLRRQRYAEAEPILARALPRRPTGRLLAFDVLLKCRWQGDTAGALRAIETWPGWLLKEDRGVAVAWQAAYWGRQPAVALRLLSQYPRDSVRDVNFSGPRAVLSARAHELAGNTAAAQSDWQAVVQRCERDLASNTQDVTALYWKAWAQARLGAPAEAQATATLLRQRLQSVASNYFTNQITAALWAIVGWNDVALADLQTEFATPVDGYSLTRAYLQLEPAFDSLRSDARFKELLARAPAPPGHSALSLTAFPPPPVADKSVAVLAFANLSDDKANEYFSDGISEELLNVLAKIPNLKVTARTSSFHFKGKDTPIPEIAKQLGVAYVVEGSVRKSGARVRITAQLIKAADGFHVWSDTFTRELKDIFAVQDEIAGLIAQQLQLKLGAIKLARAVDPEAHRLMLEGRHFLAPRTSTGFDQAERAFSQALKIDPQFAQAQAGLATTTALRGRYRLLDGVGRVEEFNQLALTQSRLALQLDSTLAEPHATMGFIYTDNHQLGDAEQEFQLAFAANPNYATAYHWHSHVLASQGRLDLALQEIGRAEALDPVSFIILFIHGFYYHDARQYEEALAVFDRAASLRQESFLPLEAERARVLLELGRNEEALAAARKVLRDPRLLVSGWYAAGEALHVLHRGGAAEEAVGLAGSLVPAMPAGSYQRGYALCAVGKFAEGLSQLEHMPDIVQSRLYWHPMLDSVRDTPAFQQLMVKFNCVEEYKVARATLTRMLKEQAAKK